MMIIRKCKHCNVLFVKDGTKKINKFGFICDDCNRKYKNNNALLNAYKNKKKNPMYNNIECSSYLGCYLAENFVKDFYNIHNIQRYGNIGYDYICNNGYKIDVKSSTLYKRKYHINWQFAIRQNQIPDYFILVGYESKENIYPLHMWQFPAKLLNTKQCFSISINNLEKYKKFDVLNR